jgi:hypothetical protein
MQINCTEPSVNMTLVTLSPESATRCCLGPLNADSNQTAAGRYQIGIFISQSSRLFIISSQVTGRPV